MQEQFEAYLDTLPIKKREACENLRIYVEEHFTDVEMEEIEYGNDRDEAEWFIWVCTLHGRRFNLVFDYETEEVERVDIRH
ncbi:hypothetical protein QTG56_24200 (plasmid) [Rossellomorea sp. AcN35-11]|nr:hypothetical protein [Rossellomorea aquimaris]WJV31742.1 hypothetical protein QTG56_24200 [Rossellomorea sp. AcN35-11]